jgi:hypothetical protein
LVRDLFFCHPTVHSVTLKPKIRVNWHRYYTLEIHGLGATALISSASVAFDGMKTGQPGNDYVATVHHFSLTPRLSQPTVKEQHATWRAHGSRLRPAVRTMSTAAAHSMRG